MSQVKLNVGEVRALLNSDGVVALLQGECDAAAGRCNGLVEWHSPMEAEAYGASVDRGKFTAIGKVYMRSLGPDGLAVAHEDAAHNTLLRGCGW